MLPILGLLIIGLTVYMRARMIEHRGWKRVLRLWLPLGFFLVIELAPFYWMAITSLKPNAELYNTRLMPLIVYHPTLKHYVDLITETSFLTWTYNTTLSRWHRLQFRWCWGSCWHTPWRACGSPGPV